MRGEKHSMEAEIKAKEAQLESMNESVIRAIYKHRVFLQEQYDRQQKLEEDLKRLKGKSYGDQHNRN